ncbi:MAG: tRNA 2-thiocytidine biosynthesis protein TtcA [Spirochaetaceae bacterium]|jgi:tRNA 2-thiocytidine biosynthesis protein TtcA|nr:tRNA 2-thiocytidine biosynthesis protein TtcA [Spirochaetaceae bacterium]
MSERFFKHNSADNIVQKLTIKAVLEKKLIEDGDRVLIAVSGGKDSSVLAMMLNAIKPAIKKDYTLSALHISSDFCSCCKKASLKESLQSWNIPFNDLFVPIIGRLKDGKKMNCYWCSTQRRTEIIRYAIENNFNKIALGHHLDDIIETFFMNITASGTLSAMPVSLKYDKYPITLIRPLCFLEERQIISCAQENGILKAACTCPYGVNSKRRDVRSRIAVFTGNSGAVKRRILKAILTLE